MVELSHEPLSWLTLERYALDELPSDERRRVEWQLARSAEDRAILAEILADDTMLPELPLPLRRSPKQRRKRATWLALSSGFAAAAALALALLTPERSIPDRRPIAGGIKGGEIALSLHSDRAGDHPSAFSPGERFKLFATCPAGFREPLHVVVFQGGARFTPLPGLPTLACGNLVPWPGAFSLDGHEPAQVCLTWSAAAEHAEEARALGPEVVCTELKPR